MSFQQEQGMISAEEQQILFSLSEISQDIKSHLTLIGELGTRKDQADTRTLQQSQIAHEPSSNAYRQLFVGTHHSLLSATSVNNSKPDRVRGNYSVRAAALLD
jgi:hypothetical protein